MRKNLTLFLSLMSCVFILAGCRKINSKELVMTAYENLQQMHIKIWIVGPEQEGEPFSNLEGSNQASYCKVNDIEIKTIKDIKDITEDICTKEGAEKLYYKKYLEEQVVYYEQNEILYRKLVEIPPILEGDVVDVVIVEEAKESIRANINFIYNTTGDPGMLDITIVKLGEKWLVNDLNEISY